MLCSRESDEQGGGFLELQIASHPRGRNIRRHGGFGNDDRSRRSRRRCLRRLKSSLSWRNRGRSRYHQSQPDSVSKRAIKDYRERTASTTSSTAWFSLTIGVSRMVDVVREATWAVVSGGDILDKSSLPQPSQFE